MLTNSRRSQTGYTLIELMIGLIVGLIVLSAVIYTFLGTLSSSRDIVNSARLNREVSGLVDLVVGELRRTGYYPVQLALNGTPSEFGVSRQDLSFGLVSGATSSCVLYSYFDDSVASGAYVNRGFRLLNGDFAFGEDNSLSCTASAGWSSMVNNLQVQIDAFDMELICRDGAGATASSAQCTATTATGTFSRAVSMALESSVPSVTGTPVWRSEIYEYVKLPNDLAAD